MFQNIAGNNAKQEDNEVKMSKIKYRFKEIFKYQNIIIYILTLLISTLSVKSKIMPFGLAMVAAAVGESVPIIGVFLMAAIGTTIGGGVAALGRFLIVSVLYVILVLFFRAKVAVEERNELVKTGSKLFAANLIVCITQSIFTSFSMNDVFMGVVSSTIIYLFYKIFVNGLSFIKNFNIKTAYTIEELIAGALIISLASLTFNSINIYSLNLSNIVIIFLIMMVGWKTKSLVGAITGIALGLVIGLVGEMSLLQIVIFSVSGILSGLLNRFGKFGVIVGFILGNVILNYWAHGEANMIYCLREVFIASIGLLMVPNRVKLELEDLIGKNKLLSDQGDNRLNPSDKNTHEFIDLDKNTNNEEIDKIKAEEKENFVQDFLDNIENIKNNIFYEAVANEENEIAKDICDKLLENDLIVDKELIQILNDHNNYVIMRDENIRNDLQEVVKIANRTLKKYDLEKVKKEEKEEKLNVKKNTTLKEKVESILKIKPEKTTQEINNSIDKINEKIKENKENKYAVKKEELKVLLKNRNVNVKDVKILKLINGKIIVELKLDYENQKLKEKEIILSISNILSKSLGTKLAFQKDRRNEDTKEYYQMYSSEDKFVIQVGSAKVTRDGKKVSGDCSLQIKLADGKYLLAIADGGDSEEISRENSKNALRVLKQVLIAGFNKSESLKGIETNIVEQKSIQSKLDVSVLDLFVGKLDMLKFNATSSYIKNKKNIKKISSLNLDKENDLKSQIQTEEIDLLDGDLLVICSDGIIENNNQKDDWVSKFLKNISTNNVQKVADLILAEAIDNNYGLVKDDMTVIVSKIVKRNKKD